MQAGTQFYMAPEQDSKDHNHKVDIYAMGIILLELLRSFNSEMEKAKALERIQEVEQQRPEMRLVKMMISQDPMERPEIAEILKTISKLQETKTSPYKKDVNLTH